MKAQALTQALVTGFGVVILILLIVILNNNAVHYKEFVAKSQLENVCIIVKSAITNIQPVSDYHSITPTVLGSVNIDLPEKIGNTNYRLLFIGNNITIELLDEPKLKYSCSTGFDLVFVGSSNGGKTSLSFIRSDYDYVEMKKI